MKSEALGMTRKKMGLASRRVKKLGRRMARVSLSRTMTGSLIVARDKPAETIDSTPIGMKRNASWEAGITSDQTVLSRSPATLPTLEIMESSANAPAHLDFASVSIIKRVSGVADANETRATFD